MNKLYESSREIKSHVERKSEHKFLPWELVPIDNSWGWWWLVLSRALHSPAVEDHTSKDV